MPILLETTRLLIKTPELSDFAELCHMQSNPIVMQYIGQGVRTPEEVLDNLNKAIQHQEKHGFSFGCVLEKVNMKYVDVRLLGEIEVAFYDHETH